MSNKSRTATLLLVLFVGIFGIHRMYVGKVASGIFQLLLTMTGFGMIITSVWVVFDFVFIVCGFFRDKQNQYITNWS